MFWIFGLEARGILTLQPGIKLTPPALEHEVLTTGPPGNSRHILLVKQSPRPDSKGGNVNSYTLIGVQGSYYVPGCCCCYLVTQSCLTLCDPWTVARQAPLSVGFCRQEYWSRLLFPSPGDLPNPGIGRWILYHWATREVSLTLKYYKWFVETDWFKKKNSRR